MVGLARELSASLYSNFRAVAQVLFFFMLERMRVHG